MHAAPLRYVIYPMADCAAMKQEDLEDGGPADGHGEESRPLLRGAAAKVFDLEDLRSRAAAKPTLDDWTYVEFENLPGWMVLRNIAAAMLQVAVVLGAYFFMQSSGHHFTPHCTKYHGPDIIEFSTKKEKLNAYACYATTLSFWTYPIVCPMIVIAVYWKNLLDKRLFYECLLNRIFLRYANKSYLCSPTFWFMLVYLATGLSSIFYIRESPAWSVRPLQELIFGLLAYLSPIFAFLIVLFSHWSANSHLVSLPQFVLRDHHKAVQLLNSCTFLRATEFRYAFWAAERLLERVQYEERMSFDLNTSEFMRLVLDQHEGQLDGKLSFWNEIECSCRCWRPYWVTQVLYLDCVRDWRSWRFRFFSGFYDVFMFAAVLVFLWSFAYTVQKFVAFQGAPPLDLLPPPEEVWERMRRNAGH